MSIQTMESTSDDEIVKTATRLDSMFASIAESIKEVGSDEDIREQAERIKAEQETKRQNAYERCGVGSKYFDKRIELYDVSTPERADNLAKVNRFIDDVNHGKPCTLWLCGENGNGKTLLGALICRQTFGHFIRVYEIDDELRDAMSFTSKRTRKGVFKDFADYDVLVIDEIGRFPSDTEKQNLFHILNDRYENEKSTVLITNLSRDDLKSYLGKALVDRFVENCTSIVFTGRSYRPTERENRNGD